MLYCDHCVMPDTRLGIKFFKDEKGKNICSACINHKNKEKIDYKARFKELEKLCDKYRGMNGKFEYDCAIAVSGGKRFSLSSAYHERKIRNESCTF
ncbi:hypothetical protein I12041_17200 [Campylobacter coli]|nr:hypothetical protein I12041_17200 [Campylobacter coli]